MVLLTGSCHKPTSTPAVWMPVQKQLTQGLAVQVHKQACALTRGFAYPTVFLFRGWKPTWVLLVPWGFYNEFLWIFAQLNVPLTMICLANTPPLEQTITCAAVHMVHPLTLIQYSSWVDNGTKKKKSSSFPDCFSTPGTTNSQTAINTFPRKMPAPLASLLATPFPL